MEFEKRSYPIEMRVQKREDGGMHEIVGHAAVFNTLSEDLGGFRERVLPGTFKRTLQVADIRSLFNHDPNQVLGRNRSGTLSIEEDMQGLAFRVIPPDTQWARDLCVSIERGDISQCSFMFVPVLTRWQEEEDLIIRELVDVDLYDVGPVTYPAYQATDVSVRSAIRDILAAGKPARDVIAQLNALNGQVANDGASGGEYQVDLENRKRKLATLI